MIISGPQRRHYTQTALWLGPNDCEYMCTCWCKAMCPQFYSGFGECAVIYEISVNIVKQDKENLKLLMQHYLNVLLKIFRGIQAFTQLFHTKRPIAALAFQVYSSFWLLIYFQKKTRREQAKFIDCVYHHTYRICLCAWPSVPYGGQGSVPCSSMVYLHSHYPKRANRLGHNAIAYKFTLNVEKWMGGGVAMWLWCGVVR